MNPFNLNTNSHYDYEVLKDLKWHCTKCELKSGQAKTWQIWRDNYGIQFDKSNPESRFWDKRIFCENCKKITVHRKLLTLERLEQTSIRANISKNLETRIKQLYDNEEAFLLRKDTPVRFLQVDHKFPQIRWNRDEVSSENATDEELKERFILLTESANQLKSRNCERCVETNRRGNFPGIYFWYEGDENWRTDPHDEKGCVGCFWYNPYKWREKLNNIVSNS